MVRIVSFIFILTICINGVFAQTDHIKSFEQELIPIRGAMRLLNYATFYYQLEEYSSALPLFIKLDQRYPERFNFVFKSGVCYLYQPGEKEKAITYLEKAKKMDPAAPDIDYYLGRAYQHNYKFEEAIDKLITVLKKEGLSEDDKAHVNRLVSQCKSGIELVKNPIKVKIENLGAPVNSNAIEYIPLINSEETMLVFTYNGIKSKGGMEAEYGQDFYFDDIFISRKEGGKWSEPAGINDVMNTDEDDAAVALSPDGNTLYLNVQSDITSADLHKSTYTDGKWSASKRLIGGVNSRFWEGSASITADGKTIYFISERPKGQGKTDLYVSKLNDDGTWGTAVNLGPDINTEVNEKAPFVHPDGKTLYFSSEGHNSMGGYDIFKCEKLKNGEWSKPVNLGYPINTPDDEKYFVVSEDRKRAYYNAIRPEGLGQQDIYIINFGKN